MIYDSKKKNLHEDTLNFFAKVQIKASYEKWLFLKNETFTKLIKTQSKFIFQISVNVSPKKFINLSPPKDMSKICPIGNSMSSRFRNQYLFKVR